MKKLIPPIVAFLLIASPVHATPLTWFFTGKTAANSQLDGKSIEGLAFQLRIFVDTDLVAITPPGLADVFFSDPPQAHFFPIHGEVEIATLGLLSLNPFNNILYFAPSGAGVTGVQYDQPDRSFILFPGSISSDTTHLGPIGTSLPLKTSNTIHFSGLDSDCFLGKGLCVFGQVKTFAAAVSAQEVPEGGSTAGYLASTLVALGFLYRRSNRNAS